MYKLLVYMRCIYYNCCLYYFYTLLYDNEKKSKSHGNYFILFISALVEVN